MLPPTVKAGSSCKVKLQSGGHVAADSQSRQHLELWGFFADISSSFFTVFCSRFLQSFIFAFLLFSTSTNQNTCTTVVLPVQELAKKSYTRTHTHMQYLQIFVLSGCCCYSITNNIVITKISIAVPLSRVLCPVCLYVHSTSRRLCTFSHRLCTFSPRFMPIVLHTHQA